MGRRAVSITANIVEGQTRKTKRDFQHFLSIANGSLVELEYYFELSLDLGYLSDDQYEALEGKRIIVGSLLGGFIRHLKNLTLDA